MQFALYDGTLGGNHYPLFSFSKCKFSMGILWMLIWQLHMLFVSISSSNGIQYCPTTTTLGMRLLCGPKATHSSSPEDNNLLVVGVNYAVVGLLGCAAKLHPSEGNHGAFILATIVGIQRWLTSAWKRAARQLCKPKIFGIFDSSAAYKLLTCTPEAWHIAARHFGSLAARELCKLDSFITW